MEDRMPDFEVLARMLGLDWPTVLAFVGVGVVVTAFVKDKFPSLTGKYIDLMVVCLMLGMNLAAYMPKIVPVIAGTLLCYIGATGGWAASKQLIKKAGTATVPPVDGGTK
jgi:hypothetical protein